MDVPALLVPVAAAYTDDTSALSEIRVARMVEWHKQRGAAGFVVGTEAGEVTSLSLVERKDLLHYVMRQAGELPIYVNLTAPTTAVAMDLCQDAYDSATGAVICPPWPGGHTNEELTGYLRAIRRFGRLPFAFLDPTGKYEIPADDYVQPGATIPRSLEEKELDRLTCFGPGPTEFWTPRGVAHPVGVFGAEVGGRILARWEVLGKPVTALLKTYGLHRIAKYVFEREEVDLGSPRPPFAPLSEKGRELVEQLLSGV